MSEHLAEPLLPTFEHDRLEVVLKPVAESSQGLQLRRWGMLALLVVTTLFLLVPLFSAAVALSVALPFLLLVPILWISLLAGLEWQGRRTHLSLGIDGLTVEHRVHGRVLRRRRIPHTDVRAIHAVDHDRAPDSTRLRRGLRIVLEDGEELLYRAPAVPLDSLQWFADEVRGVSRRAAERAEGEAPEELLALLTPEARRYASASIPPEDRDGETQARRESARRAHPGVRGVREPTGQG